MPRVDHHAPDPVARVVLLGASNLRLSRSQLLRGILNRLGGPLEVYLADGFGRSYGTWSSIPGRALPSIMRCGLWDSLQQSPTLPTFAMLTDVGNDLLYGAPPRQLVGWVANCVSRLRAMDAQIVVTELPVSSILAMSNVQFQIFRTIFFPPSRLTYSDARQLATETNDRLRELANECNCVSIEMQKSWYGIDPIHVRRRHRTHAWRSVLDGWLVPLCDLEAAVFPFIDSVCVKTAIPAEWRLVGWRRTHVQPFVTLRGGSRLHVY